ncbi:MAG: acyl-protein synthetase [Lachnospiraceae bacterium]|nr:acyl-protein synthetase [Lachnospiraceae bacterium]
MDNYKEEVLDVLMEKSPYSLSANSLKEILAKGLSSLTIYHMCKCELYEKMLSGIGIRRDRKADIEEIPFLPVRLFKELELKSIPDEEVLKTMTSSGTTGQAVSKIYLDKTTSANQQKAMVKIVSDFTGKSRMPMIIIDCPSVVKDRAMFSARGAGILGFSLFGTKRIYALRDDMTLDVEGVQAFLEEHKGERIFLFGFTFMIWQHFYKELLRLKEKGVTFDLSGTIMIHGGGWKKLVSEAVSRNEFHERLYDVCGLSDIHDYYGMVEQTGSIFMECECGHLHASIFSDVITRRAVDFSPCDIGEKGIIQVLSVLPESYPGHSLLTEDEGIIEGIDDCPCGRKGKYFKVVGRMKEAEIRGCSDTYAEKYK